MENLKTFVGLSDTAKTGTWFIRGQGSDIGFLAPMQTESHSGFLVDSISVDDPGIEGETIVLFPANILPQISHTWVLWPAVDEPDLEHPPAGRDDGDWYILNMHSGMALSLTTPTSNSSALTQRPVGGGPPGTRDAQIWRIGLDDKNALHIVSKANRKHLGAKGLSVEIVDGDSKAEWLGLYLFSHFELPARPPQLPDGPPPQPALVAATRPPEMPRALVGRTYLPFYAIADPAKSATWKIQNSPYYYIDQYDQYQWKQSSDNRNVESPGTLEFQKTRATSYSNLEEFSSTTSVKFSGEAFGIKTELSETIGYKKQETKGGSDSSVFKVTHAVPPDTFLAAWQVTHYYELRRANGEHVKGWEQAGEDIKYSQFPPPADQGITGCGEH